MPGRHFSRNAFGTGSRSLEANKFERRFAVIFPLFPPPFVLSRLIYGGDFEWTEGDVTISDWIYKKCGGTTGHQSN